MASAVIAVIGTDIKGVCRYMQEKVNAKLVAFEDGGFRGDYTYGLRAVYKLLAKQIAKDCYKKEEKTYQIIGGVGWFLPNPFRRVGVTAADE